MAEPVSIVAEDESQEESQPIGRDLFDPARLKRTLESAECEIRGQKRTIFFWTPATLEERAAARKSVTMDANGEFHSHIDRWIDVIILRVRDQKGKPVFFNTDRKRLLQWPADDIQAMILALGAGSADEIGLDELTDEAGKD